MDNTLIRPISQDDYEDLKRIDDDYASAFKLEAMLTLGSLNFYARTGHAFASLKAETLTGFILAQSVWNGYRPVLQMNRLAVKDPNDNDARKALFEALTKSAYDAAVYDLQVLLPSADNAALDVANKQQYQKDDITVLTRTLGSRGAS